MTDLERQSIAAHIAAHADEALARAGELAEVPGVHEALVLSASALGYEREDVGVDAGVLAGQWFALGRSYQERVDAATLRRIQAGAA